MLQNEQFEYSPSPHRLVMGEVSRLTLPQMTCMQNSRYTKCEYTGAYYLLSESFIFLRKIACYWQLYEVAALCNCAKVYL